MIRVALLLQFALILISSGLLTSCVTSEKTQYKLGLQTDYKSYVPAHIDVLGCKVWPKPSALEGSEFTNIDPKSAASLCAALDDYVIRSFGNQPFMQGYSPGVVSKMLIEQSKSKLLADMYKAWMVHPNDCAECAEPASYYRNGVAIKQEWLVYLNSLSRSTRHADAVLVPMIYNAVEDKTNDRGLYISRRRAGVVLYLLDTNNGNLIWLSQRMSDVNSKNFDDFEPFPPWGDLGDRLLVDALWMEFPGRIVN